MSEKRSLSLTTTSSEKKSVAMLSVLIVGRIYEYDEVQKITNRVIQKFTELIDTTFYFMN